MCPNCLHSEVMASEPSFQGSYSDPPDPVQRRAQARHSKTTAHPSHDHTCDPGSLVHPSFVRKSNTHPKYTRVRIYLGLHATPPPQQQQQQQQQPACLPAAHSTAVDIHVRRAAASYVRTPSLPELDSMIGDAKGSIVLMLYLDNHEGQANYGIMQVHVQVHLHEG
ncbi:hypothetical protein BS50DRAFT_240582 [Corynespora cassiicola Philippines]|uniref:Uncharacterized protein n=1 Tax=Corynespora cassiicola Philippines TaxID=1448308 RepID=A0A2T2P2T6_CORCC|nr:hypothetical protein BS50DRAFT_240582 [Corynespora cassiicola Philippines]